MEGLQPLGIAAWVVNAHFIKQVPGRKTDMGDSQWLAVLASFGLVRPSFIPPKDLRELRLASRCRRKLTTTLVKVSLGFVRGIHAGVSSRNIAKSPQQN